MQWGPMKKQRGNYPHTEFFPCVFSFFLRLIFINTILIHIYSDYFTWESHRLRCINRKAKDSLCQCARDCHYALSIKNTRKLFHLPARDQMVKMRIQTPYIPEWVNQRYRLFCHAGKVPPEKALHPTWPFIGHCLQRSHRITNQQ